MPRLMSQTLSVASPRRFKPSMVEAAAQALSDYQCLVFDKHGNHGQLWDEVQREIDRRGLTRWDAKGKPHG